MFFIIMKMIKLGRCLNLKGKLKEKNSKNRKIFIAVMLILPVLHWCVFWLYVNFNSFVLAFKTPRTYVWTLSNFSQFWSELTMPGGKIGLAVKNTLGYFGLGILLMFLNLIMAYFFYKRIAGYKIFRIIFYLPSIISGVAMVAVYTAFIKLGGPLDAIVKWFGGRLPETGLIHNSHTATPTIMVFNIWTGFTTNVLLFGGALARIPIELIESARLDGCGPMRELTSITVPLIWPTMSTMVIFSLTGIFGASGPILLFKADNYDTMTISYWIFKQVYGSGAVGGTGSYGLVSAAGLCFTAVGVPLIMFVRWLLNKIPLVEY